MSKFIEWWYDNIVNFLFGGFVLFLVIVILAGLYGLDYAYRWQQRPLICIDSRQVSKIENVTTPGIGGEGQKEYFLLTFKDGSQYRKLDYESPTPKINDMYCLKKVTK